MIRYQNFGWEELLGWAENFTALLHIDNVLRLQAKGQQNALSENYDSMNFVD